MAMQQVTKKLDEIIPEWGEQAYVPAANPFMAQALERCEEMKRAHPEIANPTATVIVSGGKVVSFENNGDIHPSFCPRIALASSSGTEYEYCPDHCHSKNHGEARAARALVEKGISVPDGEAFLAGHYWACMPCWEALKSAGVTKLRLVEDADARYKIGRHKNPKSGMLPRPVAIQLIGEAPGGARESLELALRRAGFEIVMQQSEVKPEVLLLLPGADNATTSSARVVDAREARDYKWILTQLSRELEPMFVK